MFGKDIAYLVQAVSKQNDKSVTIVKKELSEKLDINIKTLDSWISQQSKVESRIGRPYVAYMRSIFEPILITGRLHALINKIFKIAPSELICFWLVCGTEVILLKNSARNELYKPVNQSKFHNDEISKRLSDVTMTIDSIQNAQIINVSGEGITKYEKQVAYHTLSSHLNGGNCYSVLKVPVIVRSTIGPRVVGLIDLYNKLEKTSDGKMMPVIVEKDIENIALFTDSQVNAIRETAHKEYTNNLRDVMQALDYIDPDTTPHNGAHTELYKSF